MRAVVVASLVGGCSGNPPTLNQLRDPILGGSAATNGQFPTVVALVENGAGSLCTGTLISSTAVLTAAHCVDPTAVGRTAQQIVGETFAIFDNVDPFVQSGGTVVGAQAIYENPSFNINDLGHDDDAIIILAQPITDRMPSMVDLDPTHVQLGVAATQVGYGISRITNNAPDQNSAGVEYFVTDQIVVDCGSSTDNANLLCFDQTNQKGQCNGDSGGPAFDPNGVVIGVVSFGDQNCIQFGADTRPSQTAAFIEQHVPNVNTAPVCGNGILEYGELCDAGAQNGANGSMCSVACTPVAGPSCGNGVVEGNEACDDGASNGQTGDPCTASCTVAPPTGSGSGSGSGSNGDNTGSGDGMHDGGGCSTGGTSDLAVALLVAGALVSARRRDLRLGRETR